jgi:hypothetical protein
MSISAVSSSALAQIETNLLADLTGTSSTASTASTTATTDSSTTTATTQLTTDMASLLKDLASGNVSESKTAIAKVQQDLKLQTASADTTDTSSSTSTSSPLDTLLTQIASSLTSTNSTAGSLQDLASYLIQNGQGTGTVVNTTA